MLGEDQDVLRALAQGRHAEREGRKAEEEIPPKADGADELGAVEIARTHDPHIAPPLLPAPHRTIGSVLQEPQQHRLPPRREAFDLVEEEGPGSAAATRPALASRASVKAPRTWPKSSLSTRLSGSAAQLMGTKGPSRRAPR
jgi:hypothetical protein